MAEKACKLLREVDDLFTDGNVDVTKYNGFTACHSYCPYEKRGKKQILRECKDNNERISALGGYLYNKLVSISNDFKGKGDNSNRHIEIFMMWLGDKLYNLENDYKTTMEESYKKHLMDYMGNYNYWNLLGSKQEYKIANVWYMRGLYSLLNCICSIVIEYNKIKNKNKNKNKNKINTKINNKIKEKIETMSKNCYQNFISIYENIKDCYSYFHLLKFLKSIYDDIRNDAIEDAEAKKEAIRKALIRNNTIKKGITQQKNDAIQMLRYVLDASTISLIDLTTSDWNQRFPNKSDQILDLNTQVCINSYSVFVKKQQERESKNRPKAETQTRSSQSGKEGNKNPQNQQIEILPPSPGPQPHPAPSLSSQNDSSLQKSQIGDSDNDKKNTGGANGNKGNPNDGSNYSTLDDPATSAPGGYFYWGSSFNGFLFDRTEVFNKAFQFIDKGRQTVKEVTNKVSNAYNSAVDNLKSAYTVSNNYISGVVNSVTTKLNPFSTFKLGNNQSVSNSLGGGGNEPNPLQSIPPPALPNGSESTSPPPLAPLPKSPDSQGSSTQIHKCPVHQIAPTDGNMGCQTPLSGQGTLSISGNNSSNTKNENVITVANVKMKEAPSIWCIGTNTKCDITGISIIVISIFAFLAIMYKYLSLGWTSKSKRKKTIKKVINSIGGKRPVQIIIKSYDRNKDLKPVINSVGRKKDSLLNIYKLMQADPVPFINLFFLLIFFVYKKKINYLEL
ncbi:PIR protein CIR protein [Plasmodium vinckei vinckei]|uniref:PIR protein CIR protein n=1 Tax=Plasmodium vinckei vinckei TaxID=54757 RepID=A0A449BNY8_PLAVN|nr:PIR protein CIR protein [Plasmodium vinckei vinckei]VEV55122.1 PIR protein CIR protein [Plasmodium vinckei vinckei]